MSDLLPATDGLFLGQDSPSKRWDGSRLRNLVRPTVFGGAYLDPLTTNVLWIGEFYTFSATQIKVYVPSGKTFKLWALGQFGCTYPDYVRIQVYNENPPGTVLQETETGSFYEGYYPPKTAAGQASLTLRGGNYHPSEFNTVYGFMVFSIE